MLYINERTKSEIDLIRKNNDALSRDIRVAIPAIVQSVDYQRQTLTAQVAIREKLILEGNIEWVDIPILLDVPFFIYSGGGYCITLPIQAGDDCLIIFSDMCIDAWWQNGGVQNQVERRRHDLSDGMAIVGFKSQPQTVSNYSANTLQIRNASGGAVIELSGNTVNINASNININSNGNTIIDGKNFLSHTHTGVDPGGGNTGGVT